MAACTALVDTGMNKTEKSRRGKSTRVGVSVTQATIILCRDMILTLADCDVPIMTSCAVAAVYALMIEADAGKGFKVVSAVT